MSERCVPACVVNDNSPDVSCSQPSLRCQECLLEVPQRYIKEIYLYLHFKTINLLNYNFFAVNSPRFKFFTKVNV